MRWLLGDGSSTDRKYATVALSAIKPGEVVVPSIWPLEVANIIRKAESKETLTEQRSGMFIKKLSSLQIEIDTQTAVFALNDILRIARGYRLSSYDASYLELALRRDIPLCTLDQDLRKAAKKAGVELFA